MTFRSKIIKLGSEVWHYGFVVPDDVALDLKKKKISRLIGTINNSLKVHTAIYSSKKEGYFITLNRDNMKQLKISEGDEVNVQLEPDKSKYGIYIAPEMEELLEQDFEGNEVFHSLTPGKQRSLIHMVSKIKNPEIRIRRGMSVLNYLKSTNGELDFKDLNEFIKKDNRESKLW